MQTKINYDKVYHKIYHRPYLKSASALPCKITRMYAGMIS